MQDLVLRNLAVLRWDLEGDCLSDSRVSGDVPLFADLLGVRGEDKAKSSSSDGRGALGGVVARDGQDGNALGEGNPPDEFVSISEIST